MARSPGAFLRDLRKNFGDVNLTTTDSNIPVMPWGWDTESGFTDVREVGDGSRNSAVVGALNVLKNRFPEPPGRVFEKSDGAEDFGEVVVDHNLSDLIEKPNPHMLGEELEQQLVAACHISGDAYWIKNRSPAGIVLELWPVIPSLMEPIPTRGWSGPVLFGGQTVNMTVPDDPYIGLFRYTIGGVETNFLPSDVVHFRLLGLDDDDHRRGFGPIKTVLRELVGDEAAGQFQTALLKKVGMMGLIFTPKVLPEGVAYASKEAAAEMQSKIAEDYGGHNRGSTFVGTGPYDVTVAQFSPEQMDLRTLHFHAEHRIASVLEVPAILAGFGSGVETSSGRSEGEALIRDFTVGKLVPLWRRYGARVTESLLIPDFEGTRDRIFRKDTRAVRALQENRVEQTSASVAGYQGGVSTRGEARGELGLEVTEDDDVFLVPATSMTIPRDSESLEPTAPSSNGEPTLTDEELADLVSG
jgi:HK97 family phage portal protein